MRFVISRIRASKLAFFPGNPLCRGRGRGLNIVHDPYSFVIKERTMNRELDVGFCGRDKGLSGLTAET